MRYALLAALLLACSGPAAAIRPSEAGKGARSKAVWLTATTSGQKTAGYYMEVSQDGAALLREVKDDYVTTRRGGIPAQLVKDFLRETESSEIVANRTGRSDDRTIFYKGEMLRVWAYVSGELTITEAPLNKFGEAFSYAFGKVRKAVLQLPADKAPAAFLRADPVVDEELDSFRAKAARDGEVPTVETYELQKIKPLMAAIKDAGRLIPLETEADVKELQAFITDFRLLGLRTSFYLPSTRGTFRCSVLDADKRPPAGAEQKPAAKKKAAKKKAHGAKRGTNG